MAAVTLNRVGLLAITLPTNLEQQCMRLQRELYVLLGDSSFRLLPPLVPLVVSKEPVDLEAVRKVTDGERLTLSLEGAAPYREGGAVWLRMRVTPEAGLESIFERAATVTSPLSNPPVPRGAAIYLGGIGGKDEPSPESLRGVSGTSSALTVAAYELAFPDSEGWWKQCNYTLTATGRIGRSVRRE